MRIQRLIDEIYRKTPIVIHEKVNYNDVESSADPLAAAARGVLVDSDNWALSQFVKI